MDWKYFLKNPENPPKQNLNFLCTGNYSHTIYIVFTAIYISFIIVLGIISNLEMI